MMKHNGQDSYRNTTPMQSRMGHQIAGQLSFLFDRMKTNMIPDSIHIWRAKNILQVTRVENAGKF
ncbi:MAG: hypothetical protein ACPIE8_04025 [Henriciella sp.]